MVPYMWLYRVEAMLVSTLGLKAEVEAANSSTRLTSSKPDRATQKIYLEFCNTAFSKMYSTKRSIGSDSSNLALAQIYRRDKDVQRYWRRSHWSEWFMDFLKGGTHMNARQTAQGTYLMTETHIHAFRE